MTTSRRPARRRADIPLDVLNRLNSGELAAGNLVEGLAIDFRILLAHVLRAQRLRSVDKYCDTVDPKAGFTTRMKQAAEVLLHRFGPAIADRLQTHPSDTVRGWACYVVGMNETLTLPQRIAAIRPFAEDPHFGVREWAWIAVRPELAKDLPTSVALLEPWTTEASINARRFAAECLRPRGVWCSHIDALKKEPAMGLPLLDPLHADPAKYVQDSVANWLNDASKTKPEWVRAVCRRWQKQSKDPATKRICQRALRSLDQVA